MADFQPEAGGGVDDAVHLFLGNQEVLSAKDYHVDIAFLQVPNAFSISIGSGASALSLMQRFPKYTPFKLCVGPVIAFMGRTDGFQRASATATELSIVGRDAMAYLVDDHIEHDKSFNNATYDELVKYAFQYAKIPGGTSLTYDSAAHILAVTGQPVFASKTTTTSVLVEAGTTEFGDVLRYHDDVSTTIQVMTGFRSDKPIQFKAGTTWYAALKKELDRGGVFLRAGIDAEGIEELTFLLSKPDGLQPPLYGIINQRGAVKNANLVTCFQPKLKDVATGRYATYIVYGRAGGGTTSRKRVVGRFDDPEMLDAGYDKRWVHVDEQVKSDQHAEYLARKQCAEDRRKERAFAYSVKGHTLPMLKDPSRRVVIAPDTTIFLQDDEHGMKGVFWIERVSYMGSGGGRTTEMTLMAPEDLVFGDGDFSRAVKRGKSILGRKGGPI